MAKEQDLPLNPQKISGVCGRLYCCLTFEYEAYRELRGQMPKVGTMVSTPAGEAKVNSVNVMKKTVMLWLTDQRQVMEMPVVDLQMQYGLTVRPTHLVEEIEAPLRAATPEDEVSAAPASVEQVEQAFVKFKALASAKDGTTMAVVSTGQYFLRSVSDGWVVYAFSVNRDDHEVVIPSPGPSASPTAAAS